MSEMLNHLIKAINYNPPENKIVFEKIMRKKYLDIKKYNEKMANLTVINNQVPIGQGCAYRGGYPV